MTPTEINALFVSSIAFLGVLGAACKWVLVRVDVKQTTADKKQENLNLTLALKESEARQELSKHMHDEIRSLRSELQVMHADSKIMMRRIYDLERTIHDTPGLKLPTTKGWPPV